MLPATNHLTLKCICRIGWVKEPREVRRPPRVSNNICTSCLSLVDECNATT